MPQTPNVNLHIKAVIYLCMKDSVFTVGHLYYACVKCYLEFFFFFFYSLFPCTPFGKVLKSPDLKINISNYYQKPAVMMHLYHLISDALY